MTQSVSNTNSLSCCKGDPVLLIGSKVKSESNLGYGKDEKTKN